MIKNRNRQAANRKRKLIRWNQIRRPDYKTQRQQSIEAAAAFDAGASLESLCATYGQPLFTMIRMLQIAGLDNEVIARAMPPANHPLMAAYNKTIKRGRKRKGRAIQINN